MNIKPAIHKVVSNIQTSLDKWLSDRGRPALLLLNRCTILNKKHCIHVTQHFFLYDAHNILVLDDLETKLFYKYMKQQQVNIKIYQP